MASVISVRQLNTYVKSLLEGDIRLNSVYVSGEISNIKCHFASGHYYFTLKDETAAVKSVMFKTAASRLKFSPENGMKVICRGRVSVYERDGQFQLYVEDIQPDGVGSLALAFEQLKEKLANEGLFDAALKKPIPKFPQKIAVVTSADAAALRDIVNVISRRCPMVSLLIAPVQVQGITAAESIVKMLNRLYEMDDIDLIILGRGGGSAEDLWCFNDEKLARKIVESQVPIISAVGHETDFTISDFVADLRAPTPSAAAELAVPDMAVIMDGINSEVLRMKSAVVNKINDSLSSVDFLAKSRVLKDYDSVMQPFYQNIDEISKRLVIFENSYLTQMGSNLSLLASKLDALSPLKVISRGFAVVKDERGAVVSSVKQLNVNENIVINFNDGKANCRVEKIIE